MNSYLSQQHMCEVKCKQPTPGSELGSSSSFPYEDKRRIFHFCLACIIYNCIPQLESFSFSLSFFLSFFQSVHINLCLSISAGLLVSLTLSVYIYIYIYNHQRQFIYLSNDLSQYVRIFLHPYVAIYPE